MIKRILSGIIGIGIAVLVIGAGGIPFLCAVLFLVAVGLMEYYRMLRAKGMKPFMGTGILTGLILVLLAYFNNSIDFDLNLLLMGIFFSIFLVFAVQLFKSGSTNAVINVGVTFFGVIYVAGLMGHFILLRNLDNNILPGSYAIWLALICTWATDSFAFFVGKSLGKRPLAPKVSPNKTLEGFFGGILGSGIAGGIIAIIIGVNVTKVLIIAMFIGVIGQIGDLFESALKRDTGIKDSGKLIPGHGGVLDRFDSALFTLPLTFYLIIILF